MKNKTTLKRLLATTTVLVSVCLSPQALSGKQHHASTDWAHVLRYEPITRSIQSRTPHQECWNEQVRYEEHHYERRSHTGTIVGGIIGGAVGNALGHRKQNKRIGTAVGAILGASIGSDITSRNNREHAPFKRYRTERRCNTTHHISYQEQVVGYHVWYRYHGEKYKTRMDHKPGKKIKVRVTVEPL